MLLHHKLWLLRAGIARAAATDDADAAVALLLLLLFLLLLPRLMVCHSPGGAHVPEVWRRHLAGSCAQVSGCRYDLGNTTGS